MLKLDTVVYVCVFYIFLPFFYFSSNQNDFFSPFVFIVQCPTIVGESEQIWTQAGQPGHPQRLDVHLDGHHERRFETLLVRFDIGNVVVVQRRGGISNHFLFTFHIMLIVSNFSFYQI